MPVSTAVTVHSWIHVSQQQSLTGSRRSAQFGMAFGRLYSKGHCDVLQSDLKKSSVLLNTAARVWWAASMRKSRASAS